MFAVQPLAAAIAGVATAEGCLIPTAAAANSFMCFPIKPIQFKSCRLSYSLRHFPSSRKAAPLRPAFVAKTSDWAQKQDQDDDGEEEEDIEEEEGNGGRAVAEGIEGVEAEVGDRVDAEEEEEPESFPEPPEGAKLFVGNLPYDVDSESLAHLFEQAGIVEVAEVIYNRETDKSRGFGFITMSTVEEAEKAVEMFHHYDYSGRLLNVNKAAPRGARLDGPHREYAPSFRVYVGNLPWQMDDARLEQVFSNHGKVINARVVIDRETGRSRGFGFVIMSSQAEMENAITSLDGQSLDGRQIRVSVAEEKPRRF